MAMSRKRWILVQLAPIARPIAPETQIHLAGTAIDPDRLIAGQRARGPVWRVACDVLGGVHHQPTAIGPRRNRRFLISDEVLMAMMPCRLMGARPSVAAERENGRQRDDGSHQHGCRPFPLTRLRWKMPPASCRKAKSATSARKPLRYLRSISARQTRHSCRGLSATLAGARPGASDRAPAPAPPAHILRAIP